MFPFLFCTKKSHTILKIRGAGASISSAILWFELGLIWSLIVFIQRSNFRKWYEDEGTKLEVMREAVIASTVIIWVTEWFESAFWNLSWNIYCWSLKFWKKCGNEKIYSWNLIAPIEIPQIGTYNDMMHFQYRQKKKNIFQHQMSQQPWQLFLMYQWNKCSSYKKSFTINLNNALLLYSTY